MSQFADIGAASRQTLPASGDVIHEALVAIREHLGMEIAYFSEFVDGRSVFRNVDAPGFEHLIQVGDSHSLDDVYCRHILEGRLPELISDTSREPLAWTLPITSAVPIGSHASIPVRRPDGSAFGMFCCLSSRPNPSLNERDLDVMRVFAGLAAKQVHRQVRDSREDLEKRAGVQAILDRGGLAMVYQPIFALASMEIVALEALCRFESEPYRSPDKWFQDAAETGLGVDLEIEAIRAALTAFETIPEAMGLSINASPETIVSGRLAALIAPAHLERTVVEITEHARVEDYALLHLALKPLRDAGLKIAIDDAGAGYSGLQHIVQMDPDIIKLDMSLTRGIDEDRARRALASAMIFYAKETGSVIVAEGIETAAELLTLKALGATRGQGYLLTRPAALGGLDLARPAGGRTVA